MRRGVDDTHEFVTRTLSTGLILIFLLIRNTFDNQECDLAEYKLQKIFSDKFFLRLKKYSNTNVAEPCHFDKAPVQVPTSSFPPYGSDSSSGSLHNFKKISNEKIFSMDFH